MEEPAARKREGGHSGRLLLRMPESLHAELAQASQREGMSLNGYIIEALTKTLRGGAPRPRPRSSAPEPQARTLLTRLLVVNLVVVAAVGVLVVVLLVQALR